MDNKDIIAPEWIAFQPARWSSGTQNLNKDEEYVFFRLCLWAYEKGDAIIDKSDRIMAAFCKSDIEFYVQILKQLEEWEKVELDGSRIYIPSVDERLTETQSKLKKKSEAGKRGAKARWDADKEAKKSPSRKSKKTKQKQHDNGNRITLDATKKTDKTKKTDTQDKTDKENKQEVLPMLPVCIPVREWEEFVEMRKGIKKPLTEYAAKKAVALLERLHGEGEPIDQVLQNSIDNCWQGLFPVKQRNGGKSNSSNILDGFD